MFADRLASVGTLAAGVAHEINNPLMAITANLDVLAQTVSDGSEEAGFIDDARIGATRIAGICTFSTRMVPARRRTSTRSPSHSRASTACTPTTLLTSVLSRARARTLRRRPRTDRVQ